MVEDGHGYDPSVDVPLGGATVNLTNTWGEPLNLDLTTSEEGAYSSPPLIPATYRLNLTLPSGFEPIRPAELILGVSGNAISRVDFPARIAIASATPPPSPTPTRTDTASPTATHEVTSTATVTSTPSTVTIRGRVWHDENLDGVQADAESGISKVLIVLRIEPDVGGGGGEAEQIYTVTERDGSYRFLGLLPHINYLLTEIDPWGHFSTTPNSVQIVSALPGSDVQIDFGDCPYWHTYLPILSKLPLVDR